MPVDVEKREKFLEWYAKELEGQVLDDDLRHGPSARIPFTSPMLTWATTGGMPIGQIGRWWGPEGSGKTLTNWGIIKCAQNYPEVISEQYEREIKLLERRKKGLAARKRAKDLKALVNRFPDGMDCIIFDAEGRADLDLARQLGINTNKDRLEIAYGNIIEEVCEAMKEAMRAYHLVILDSASSCESIEEAGQGVGDRDIASGPRSWRRLKRVSRAMDKRENTLIIVDQVRTQMIKAGNINRAVLDAPNVRIIKHYSSVTIQYDQGKKLYLDKNGLLTDDYEKASNDYPALGTDGKEAHGLEMRCKVLKNSTGRPFRNARMRFTFTVANQHGEVVLETGFDEAFELLESAIEFGIMEVTAAGGWHYLLDHNFKRTGKKWQGAPKARNAVQNDRQVRERILQRLIEMR